MCFACVISVYLVHLRLVELQRASAPCAYLVNPVTPEIAKLVLTLYLGREAIRMPHATCGAGAALRIHARYIIMRNHAQY